MSVANRLSNLFRASVAVLGLGIACLLGSPASAQLDRGAALAELNRHDYAHRDLQLFAQGLHLDDYQRLILDSLFQDYLDRFEAGWQGTQDRIQALLEDIPQLERSDQSKILDQIMAPFEEWRIQKDRLKQRFEDDVQAILNAEQMENWPAFQQQMTREKTLHYGRLSGESLNLFHHVRELRMDDRSYMNLEPVLNQYSDELNEALHRRNSIMRQGQTEFIQGLRMHGSVPPPTRVGEEITARVRIRDINLRYVDEIAQRLPERYVDEFRDRAHEAAFPRIYRQLPAMRLIARALEIEDLDDETREAIEEIRDTFLAEMAHLNNRLHDATIAFEPRQYRNQADRDAARHTGETVERIDDPTRPIFMERDERAQYYVQLVQSLLTPEQAGSLPGAERRVGREGREQRGGAMRGRTPATPSGGGRGGSPTNPEDG